MSVQLHIGENHIIAYLSGEIDHHLAKNIREKIDSAVERIIPEHLALDFGSVTFMDSSGIGLVMGRYKLMQALGGTVSVENVPASLKKVMDIAGVSKLCQNGEVHTANGGKN